MEKIRYTSAVYGTYVYLHVSELTEVEEGEDLRGGSGLDLRLDDGGSWTIQRAGFLRLDTAIT